MLLDRPDVLAEVAAQFDAYERALVADDAETVVGFFAPGAVRFGIADQQVGLAEQLKWRRAQPPLSTGRRLHDTRITAYGTDVAVVTTLFGYRGGTVTGRQSQTWVRLPEGWRIVTAHVSEPAPDPAQGLVTRGSGPIAHYAADLRSGPARPDPGPPEPSAYSMPEPARDTGSRTGHR